MTEKIEHKFRQSDLSTLDRCSWAWHLGQTRETDAASIGSSVHAALEARLAGDVDTLGEMHSILEMDFVARTEDPNFAWVKWAGGDLSIPAALRFGEACITNWWNHYTDYFVDFDHIEPEVHFDLPFYEDDERVIRLSGTMDVLLTTNESDAESMWQTSRIMDHKTSSRGEWYRDKVLEVTRWGIQPTCYTWAASQLVGYPVTEFIYSVLHAKGVQKFSVERGPADWQFLTDRVLAYAKMVEADVFVPNPSSLLCSSKWCEHWSGCAGKYVSES